VEWLLLLLLLLIPMALSRTPLFAEIVALKARMTSFSGWEMPVQFSGIAQEHQQVRTGVGMFDISHMGKFLLRGVGVLDALQTLVPSDLSRLQPGDAQYTVLLNQAGGVLDDLIIYYQGAVNGSGGMEERVVVIVNAATRLADWEWMMGQLAGRQPAIAATDVTLDQVLIAVQGPQAVATLQTLVPEALSQVKRFGHLEGTVLGHPAFLARTGYTGEDGFEVMVSPEVGVELWRSLLAAGVMPCGLGARDTLRLEAAMALYGQDMDAHTTPLEAGLGWLVHLDRKGDFIGRAVLDDQKANGVTRRLVGIEMQGRAIARHGYPVLHDGEVVGEVTSGTWSLTLERAIALAYVPTALSKLGQSLTVEIRGKGCAGRVVKKPFYKREGS